MKQYLLFSYGTYYPSGGIYDFEKSFDSIEYAFNFWENKHEYVNYQIVDRDTFEIVKTND